MLILGIDPGFARVGWAILENKGQKYNLLNCNCIETSKEIILEKRLENIYKRINVLLKKYNPDALAIEDLFFTNNAKTAFKVGEARGVIILAATIQKTPVFSYTPLQVKTAVTGYGKADKPQVGRMVKAILKLQNLPRLDDTVDAIAVGLTHAFTNRFK